MKKVINIFYAEEVKKNNYYTGLVYELENGTYFVASQDGYITPGLIFTKEGFNRAFLVVQSEDNTNE